MVLPNVNPMFVGVDVGLIVGAAAGVEDDVCAGVVCDVFVWAGVGVGC